MQRGSRRSGSAGARKIYEVSSSSASSSSTSSTTTITLPRTPHSKLTGNPPKQPSESRLPPLRAESFAGVTKHQHFIRPADARRKHSDLIVRVSGSQKEKNAKPLKPQLVTEKIRQAGDAVTQSLKVIPNEADDHGKVSDIKAPQNESASGAKSEPAEERSVIADNERKEDRKDAQKVSFNVEKTKADEKPAPAPPKPVIPNKGRQLSFPVTAPTAEVKRQIDVAPDGGQRQGQKPLSELVSEAQRIPEVLPSSDCVRHLLEAVKRAKVRLATFILDAAPRPGLLNCRDHMGHTPLMLACQVQDEERRDRLVRLLLCRGADVNLKDENGRTVLMHACLEQCNDVLLLLLTHNVDPDAQDNDGNTALILCSMIGNAVAVEALIRHFRRLGLQVDRYNKAGHTALVAAAQNGHLACVRALVVTGRAAPSLPDRHTRKTPAEYLQESGYGPVELYFLRPPTKKFRNIAKLASSFIKSRSTTCLLSFDSLRVPGSGPVEIKSSSCEDLSTPRYPSVGPDPEFQQSMDGRCPTCRRKFHEALVPLCVPSLVVSEEANMASVVKDAACQTEIHFPLSPSVEVPRTQVVLGSIRRRSLPDFIFDDDI